MRTDQRIWQVINPIFIRHRLDFIVNHFAYDNITWVKQPMVGRLDIKKFQKQLLSFTDFAQEYDLNQPIAPMLTKIGSLLGTSLRNPQCASLYTSWGSETPTGLELYHELEQWQQQLLTLDTHVRQKQWELLLSLENIMPWEQFNGFLAKLVWNIVRQYLGLPLAIIPIKQKQAYYSCLLANSDALLR